MKLRGINKMKIYHGTSCRNIKRFDLNHAREKTDFGKGVYFGIDLNLAKRASCKAGKMGAVYECDLDLKLFNVFECRDEDFIYTVYLCRLGLEDIAEDAVDNFEEVYSKWKSGEITARKAMNELGIKSNTFYRRVKQHEASIG